MVTLEKSPIVHGMPDTRVALIAENVAISSRGYLRFVTFAVTGGVPSMVSL